MIWGLLNWSTLWVENKMFCLIQEEKQKESESAHEFLDPYFISNFRIKRYGVGERKSKLCKSDFKIVVLYL